MSIDTFELTPSNTLAMEVQEDGVRITVKEEGSDGERVSYSAVHGRDFFESSQKRKTIANEIEKNSDVKASDTKDAFIQLCNRISGNDLSKDRKELFRTELTQQLLDETVSVDVYVSEETSIEVTLEKDGRKDSIEFTPGEWTTSSPARLSERYYNAFVERIEVSGEEWDDLVEEWEEMKTVAARETATTWDAIVERVVNTLKKRHVPHEDREAFKNDEKTTWYRDGEDGPTLWVKSAFVADLLDDSGKTPEELSELSKQLSKRDVTKGTTKKRSGVRAYPFDPEEIGVSENEVHTNSDDDGPEVEP